MKRIASLLVVFCCMATSLVAKDNYVKDDAASGKADNIIGKYLIEDEQGTSEAVFFKHTDGTYRCRTIGGKPEYDKNGKLLLDVLNPDPELRNIPIHEAIIISYLKYNPEKKQWDGKIHNPKNRMEKADCTIDLGNGGKTMRVRGHLGPIGANRYWKVLK